MTDEPDVSSQQRQILDFISGHHTQTGTFPSVREIAAHMKFKSTNTVDYHVRRLERAGLLRRSTRLARSFALPASGETTRGRATPSIPIIGRVAAGTPILAEQNYDGLVNFANYFTCDDRTYALKVQGDSMIGAGITDGDLVVVRQQPQVANGEIGVAIIGDEATVKRIYDDGNTWRLEPENPALKAIIVEKNEGSFAIAGKVIGVIRKL